MDTGYWFLATIWTISMIYGVADLFSNKFFKEYLGSIALHIAFCLVGFVGLAVIGYFAGFDFWAIKLTLYYIPFYLIGYLYGHIQDWLTEKSWPKTVMNCVLVLSLGIWLAMISRVDFFVGGNGFVFIAARFIASLFGCIAIIGLFTNVFDGRSNFSHDKLLADVGSHSDGNQDCSTQSVHEITSSRESASGRFFCWTGIHSLEIYLVHYFILCLLRFIEPPLLHSAIGWLLVAVNFTITVSFSCMFITIISKNKLLNKILYWK